MFTTDGLLEQLRERVLPQRMRRWTSVARSLAGKSLGDFNDSAQAVILDILAALDTATRNEGLVELEEGEAEIHVYGEIVAAMNKVLPAEHPFALGILKVRGKKGYDFISLERKEHGIFHELISTEIIPFAVAFSADDLADGYFHLEIFHPGDDRWLDI